MCRYNDFDAEFFSKAHRRARKEHKCIECEAAIRPGDVYLKLSGKNDRYMWAENVCATCEAWAEAFFAAEREHCGGHDGGWLIGHLWDDIVDFVRDHLGYDPGTGAPRPLPQPEPRPHGDVLM